MNVGAEVGSWEGLVVSVTPDSSMGINPLCARYMGGHDDVGIYSPYVANMTQNMGFTQFKVTGCEFAAYTATVPYVSVFTPNIAGVENEDSYSGGNTSETADVWFDRYPSAATEGAAIGPINMFYVHFNRYCQETTPGPSFLMTDSTGSPTTLIGPVIKHAGSSSSPTCLQLGTASASIGTINRLIVEDMAASAVRLPIMVYGNLNYASLSKIGFGAYAPYLALNVTGSIAYSTVFLEQGQSYYAGGGVTDSLISNLAPGGNNTSVLDVANKIRLNGQTGPGIIFGSAIPTSGSYNKGDLIINNSPSISAPMAWRCNSGGTFGTLSNVTGTISQGSAQLTVNTLTGLSPGNFISIAGVSGTKQILAIDSVNNIAYLSSTANAGVSGAAVAYVAPTFLSAPASSGATGSRPSLQSTDIGYLYYDTTLSQLVCWSGTSWVVIGGVSFDANSNLEVPIGSYYGGVTGNTISSNAVTINWLTGGNVQRVTNNGTAAVAVTFTAPSGPGFFTLKITSAASGYGFTWPSSVHWQSGVAPTLTNTSGNWDILTFFYDGSIYTGFPNALNCQ
jgi:hypothetical protein